jgi:hypothetical protein
MKKLLLICLLVVAFSAVSFAQPQKLYFDPSLAIGIPESRIFDEISYVPLETKHESLFGKINQLIVTQQYFVILDRDTEAIYFFDKTGKFIKKYRNRGYDIRSIRYDEKRNALFIAGLNKNFSPFQKDIQAALDNPISNSSVRYARAVYYDLDDVKKPKIEILKNFDIVLAYPYIFNENQWAYSYIYSNKNWADTQDYELKISDGRNTIANYFPYNRRHSSIYYGNPEKISFYKTFNDSTLLFTRPFNYTIYQLSPHAVTELYSITLPAASTIPASFYSQNFGSRTAVEDYKMKNAGFAWGVQNVIDLNRYLFFSLDFFKNFRERNFIFDKKTIQFFNLSKLTPDSANAFLPVVGNGIQSYDKNCLYSSISSTTMFQNKNANEKRNPKYSAALQRYFEKGKSDDNPVIMILKPKSN